MALVRRQLLQLAGAVMASASGCPHAQAQAYPGRPVRMIVPFTAGGPTDVIARIIAQKLPNLGASKSMSKTFRRAQAMSGQPPPQRQPRMAIRLSSSPAASSSIRASMPNVTWDPVRDFAPISLIAASAHILAVHPSVPANTVKELAALVKANPGKYSYASPGAGTTGQLAGELFKLSLGLDLLHVPFNGATPALTSTIGGHTPILFAALPGVAASIEDGKLRALAMTGGKRSQVLPDVPTMIEAGFPNQESIFPAGHCGSGRNAPGHHRTLAPRDRPHSRAARREGTSCGDRLRTGRQYAEEFGAWIKAEGPRWAKSHSRRQHQEIE